MRPRLFLICLEILGIDHRRYMDIACAIELMHSYSVVHDDLPGMDDDDYRSGIPSVHKKFGESVGILVGDALLTMVFEVISSTDSVDDSVKVKLCKAISGACGVNGMIFGQYLDVVVDKQDCALQIDKIYANKTGKLFEVCGVFASVVHGDDVRSRDLCGELAFSVGMLLQVVDDIEDKDKDEISNWVKIFGINSAEKKARDLLQSTDNTLNSLKEKGKIDVDNAGIAEARRLIEIIYQKSISVN
ncbi:polyprenyl synthetase family protein [Rickettsiales bacterium]|nr:polyprenyl synthetase family protein [Rickettsiales bacterium]